MVGTTFFFSDVHNATVEYVSSLKYLGASISSDEGLAFLAAGDLRNFYISSNVILNTLHKPNEEVLLHLIYTNCAPTITYASAVKEYRSCDMHDCTVALNNAIRKIFAYNRWESVRMLRQNFGYKSLMEIFFFSRRKFLESLPTHRNSIVSFLSSLAV